MYELNQKQNLVTLFNEKITPPLRFIYYITCILNENNFQFGIVLKISHSIIKCQNKIVLNVDTNIFQRLDLLKESLQEQIKTLYKILIDQLTYLFLLYGFGWTMQSRLNCLINIFIILYINQQMLN
ncbi:unnamed protein product [Paramecium sonneborni]|uniref:Uncharacterized protein n=1 Tax=Paramecium sonneborni TaxID=65129 RepID=A0A8S1RQ89_9CILI|nr:unnamed protein product [Paramecium sonneborni]